MPEITLVRLPDTQITQEEKDIASRVLLGKVDGLGEKGRKQWRGFLRRLFKMEPGEMVDIKTHQERLGWYHRKHMALEQNLFESQERFEDFDAFRTWLKVGSGFVTWYPGPKGGVIPVPRSISYAKLEQGEMEEVHGKMIEFMRSGHAQKTLWPHLNEQGRMEMMQTILEGFGE